MDFLAEITKQGFGYLLFGFACIVIVRLSNKVDSLVKENQALSEKRVTDIVTMKDSYMELAQSIKEAQLTNTYQIQEMAKAQIQIASAQVQIVSDLRNFIVRQGQT